jgi:ferrous iron transport protein B
MASCHDTPAKPEKAEKFVVSTTVTELTGPRRHQPLAMRTVALIGPPNSGKSTLFNRLTGMRQKVANYPGVTVEQRAGKLAGGHGLKDITLIDLPGIYGMNAQSEDALVSIGVLKGEMPGTPLPDAVLLVLDATNLGRHLVLAAQILSLNLPTLILLNMKDQLDERGGSVDTFKMAQELGTPVALISAAQTAGLDAVYRFLEETGGKRQMVQLPVLQNPGLCRDWAVQVGRRSDYQAPASPAWTRRLDKIVLHPVWGPAIFLAIVIGVFQLVFTVGQTLGDGLTNLLQRGGEFFAGYIHIPWLQSLLLDGVWKGVGSVLAFLPQILVLFFFIGLLEDSGYLARAALIADRTMARLGLNGKAFIPLLSAYACAVPAIMATRTIENKRDRLATILIAPFMTCSARLPIYTLIIAAFIPNKAIIPHLIGLRAAAMIGLYILGFAAAFVTARLLKSSVLKTAKAPFVLELPQYRWPTVQSISYRLYDRAKVFVVRAGTIILGCTVILWALAALPVHDGIISNIGVSWLANVGRFFEPIIHPLGFNWKIGIGLLSSLVAREVIVGTLGTLYGADPATHNLSLQAAVRGDLTPGAAFALVVFFAFAMQCTSTLAVVKRETNSWKWPIIQFTYMSGMAYFAALAVNQLSRFF